MDSRDYNLSLRLSCVVFVEVQRVVIWAIQSNPSAVFTTGAKVVRIRYIQHLKLCAIKGERTDNGVSCKRESKLTQFLPTFEIMPGYIRVQFEIIMKDLNSRGLTYTTELSNEP